MEREVSDGDDWILNTFYMSTISDDVLKENSFIYIGELIKDVYSSVSLRWQFLGYFMGLAATI